MVSTFDDAGRQGQRATERRSVAIRGVTDRRGRERRVALVTGGASGIGAATAIELGRLGMAVAIGDFDSSDKAQRVAERVRELGAESEAYDVDVRDYEAVAEMVDAVTRDFGAADVLVANAGVEEQSRIESGDPARWQQVVETNLLGVAYSVRAVLGTMLERDSGDIVINASASGTRISFGNPLYTASKWGAVGFARMLRNQLVAESSAVRVTVLEPGLTDTDLARSIPGVAPRVDAGHALVPEDVSGLIGWIIQQPPHVLLGEVRIEPQFKYVPPSFGARVGGKIARTLTR